MSAAESARGGSLSAMTPASCIAAGGPTAIARTLKPRASSSLAAAPAAGGDDGASRTISANAPFGPTLASRRCASSLVRPLVDAPADSPGAALATDAAGEGLTMVHAVATNAPTRSLARETVLHHRPA
jgi:hypothetical protein